MTRSPVPAQEDAADRPRGSVRPVVSTAVLTLAALASSGTALAAAPAPGNGSAIFRDAGTDPSTGATTPTTDPTATPPADGSDPGAPPPTTTTPVAPPPTTTTATPTTTTTTVTAPVTTPAPATPAPKAKPKAHPKPKHDAKPSHPAKPHKHADRSVSAAPGADTGAVTGGADKVDPAAAALQAPQSAPVPDLLLEQFNIPPFLLPVYQAAATAYQVPWTVLAAINSVETNYGRNVAVSSAGAVGWMQFMPATWKLYGVDANVDGHRDPYNPADAIFAAARYLHAAGADTDLHGAVFAYNHSDAYVAEVMSRAKALSELPNDLVDSLTGLAEARFPIPGKGVHVQQTLGPRKWVILHANANRRVIAPADGRVVSLGANARLGRFVVVEDAFGNRFTYAKLGSIAAHYAVPREHVVSKAAIDRELHLPHHDAPPGAAASVGTLRRTADRVAAHRTFDELAYKPASTRPVAVKTTVAVEPSMAAEMATLRRSHLAGTPSERTITARAIGLKPRQVTLRELKPGAHIVAGTILGYVGYRAPGRSVPVHFAVRPAGHATPRVDARPLLRGWRLLRSTKVYGPAGSSTLEASDGRLGLGQTLLLDKQSLARKVLDDKRIQIYQCGREDIASGQIDRRVLETLEFLADSGLYPTVTALKCGHSLMTASGNISEHSTGDAVDIAAINGIPIVGHQGPGTITDITIRKLLTLQGTMKPHQIISLMTFPGTDNTLSLPDHYDHIHVGFHPDGSTPGATSPTTSLAPDQWNTLMARLRHVDEPAVSTHVSRFALRAKKHS